MPLIHIALHFIIPAIVVLIALRKQWKTAYLVMIIATLLVDADHWLADPIYDPNRCSISFHPLHGIWSITIYLLLCLIPFIPKVCFENTKQNRVIQHGFSILFYAGISLVIHMILDAIDCQLTTNSWFTP